jgi:aspartate/methionine/tyrosine aminotransferase
MADWLEDAAGVTRYLARQSTEYDDRRRVLREVLSGAGFPLDQAVFGESAPYVLLPVPPRFTGRSHDYLEACAVRAGVFMSEVWPADRDTGVHADEYAGHVRMYIGPPSPELAEAVSRLHETGLGYSEE